MLYWPTPQALTSIRPLPLAQPQIDLIVLKRPPPIWITDLLEPTARRRDAQRRQSRYPRGPGVIR